MGVGVGSGVGGATGFEKFVTFFVKVQNVVGPFKKRNSAGLSGVDPLISTTISISDAV